MTKKPMGAVNSTVTGNYHCQTKKTDDNAVMVALQLKSKIKAVRSFSHASKISIRNNGHMIVFKTFIQIIITSKARKATFTTETTTEFNIAPAVTETCETVELCTTLTPI